MNTWQGDIWHDHETGLLWQSNTPGQMTWYAAREYAKTLTLVEYSDWRIPSAAELESLLDRTLYRPEMRKSVPFRDHRSYWSSTTFEKNTKNAWIVMFDGAYVLSYPKTNAYWVRCVRNNPKIS